LKKLIGILICFLILITCTGCWNKKEPKDLAIVNSLIYNKKEDGKYQVVVEFLDLTGAGDQGGGESSGKKFTTETAQGASFREALANVSANVEKTIYGGHTHVRFFTESTAKGDMAATLDYLLRDHLTDETPLMVMVKGDEPEKIYESSMGLSDSVGVYIDSMQVSQQKTTSKSVFVTTLDFVKDFFDDGKQPVAGVIEIVQSESDKQESSGSQKSDGGSEGGEDVNKIVYEGLAAFKEDKLVGYFNGIEARAYNFIIGDIGVAMISIPFKDSYAVCEVTDASADIKTKIEDKDATIDVKISAKIRVIADGTDENVSEPSVMKEIEGIFNNQLLPEITSAIAKAQHEFKSDIFGFGSYVHTQNPQEWKKIKEQWDDIFSNAAVNVTVESDVYQTGEMRDSVLSEFTED